MYIKLHREREEREDEGRYSLYCMLKADKDS